MELIQKIDLLDKNPMTIFNRWFQEAQESDSIGNTGVFSLATASRNGRPSSRSMYLRGLGAEGFKIYCDMKNSQKGQDLEENPVCSAVFCWVVKDGDSFEAKQVRIFGRVSKLPRSECQQYFDSEPLSSKIRASFPQSLPAESPNAILEFAKAIEKKFVESEDWIKAADHWGGYLIEPEEMEFYHGKRDGINQRVRFRKLDESSALNEYSHRGDNDWVYEYLFP